ncbi:hypothetical protein LTR84_003838 [Exophiala bonariae]|uniref:Xeroderma pigmentosum group C-complementing protein n=1 Tax=Exophiala bonariae TaxID=1690606 RepID=A0AAV9N6M5_9EURO|nr:hypothetical protein LTR84_003838 [Exophiala bonariae]
MPPRKSRSARVPVQRTRRSGRRSGAVDHGIPDVYGDMVAEAVADERNDEKLDKRAPKRRKISEESAGDIQLDFDLFGPSQADVESGQIQDSGDAGLPLQQVIYDDFEGSDDESDIEFEDVELEPTDNLAGADQKPEQKTLRLDLSTSSDHGRQTIQRRKPVGPAERKKRLEVHKAHLICLLAHLSSRNRWCESRAIHDILKPLVPRKLVSLFHVDESKPQYQRSHSFTKGIEEICLLWRTTWTVSARGMRRAHWKNEVDALKESEDAEDLIDFDDFKTAALSHSGSRDLGAQLFCALLRSVAVDARLVCSLQVLPFSGVAKGQTPENPKPQYYQAPSQNYDSSPFARSERTSKPARKRIVESPFPVFWVEVFSPATAIWMPLDPLVRNTINKPKTGFEPPAADQLNSMTYVLAFEDDGAAKDVTRRYTQWFNAKTRKQRVESTKGGEQWWKSTIGFFRKAFTELRDEIEDADLVRRAETEAMPRSVQDFKGHPVYVLERHLRMNEVIQPKHEVGKVAAGVSKNAKLESVYRRRDVHLCRTADAWYRRGRDVKEGEQPLKRFVPKRKIEAVAQVAGEFEDDDDDADEGKALYAEYQTSVYEPPPVAEGQIPKNAFGNLDIYVPSMIPAGAAHIRHPLAAQAAKVLGIEFVSAVTGFEFKGRQGTAVVDGVVVEISMCNALANVIEGLELQASEEVEAQRSGIILGMWRSWLTALRVRERVQREYGGDQDDRKSNDVSDNDENNDASYQEDGEADGGFIPEDPDEIPSDIGEAAPRGFSNLKPMGQLLPPEVIHQAIIIVRSPNSLPTTKVSDKADDEMEDLFNNDEQQMPPAKSTGPQVEHGVDGTSEVEPNETNPGGGFIPDDEGSVEGGGFLPDAEDAANESPPNQAKHTTTFRDDDLQYTAGGFIPDPDPGGVEGILEPSAGNVATLMNNTASKGNPDINTLTAGEVIVMTTPQDVPTDQPPTETSPPQTTRDENESHPKAPKSPHSSSSLRSENSLLSHDPDEEDAEPEWLLNSLGEID